MIIPAILHTTSDPRRYERELWGTYTEPEEPPISGPAGGGGQREPIQITTSQPDTRALEAAERQREREESIKREQASEERIAKEKREEKEEAAKIRDEERAERNAPPAAAPGPPEVARQEPQPVTTGGPPQVARQEPQPITAAVRVGARASSRTSGGLGRQ